MSTARPLLSLIVLLAVLPLAQVVPAQGTFTVVDNEAIPGLSDVVVVERERWKYAVTLSYTENKAYSFRVEPSGAMTPVSSASTGIGPRAVAMAHDGKYAVTANSGSDDMTVMSIGDDGSLTKVGNNVPSGGDNPFDVAVAFDDLVVVANRDSDAVALFSIDRRGNMRQLSSQSAGIDPHVIAVSPQGIVAVANSTSNDLTIFDVDRKGNMFLVDEAFPVGNSPKAVAFGEDGRSLFVATRSAPGVEDQIQAYKVDRGNGNPTLEPAGSTPGGTLVTDLEIAAKLLFAATVNPTTGRDQVRAYERQGTQLTPGPIVETAGPQPSFKNLASARFRGSGYERIVVLSEYQAGWLRSVGYGAP